MSRVFVSWARFALRHRWVVIVGLIVVTGACIYQLNNAPLDMDNSSEAFVDKDSPIREALDGLRAQFGQEELFLLLAEGDVFSLPFLESLRQLHQAAEDLGVALGETINLPDPSDDWYGQKGGSLFEEVTSLTNIRQPQSVEGAIAISELMNPWPTEATLPAFKGRVLKDPSLEKRLVSPSGQHAVVLVRTSYLQSSDAIQVLQAMRELAQQTSRPGFTVTISGSPAMAARATELSIIDLEWLSLWSSLLMLTTLLFVFRHPMGIIGPGIVIALSVIWTFGAMSFLSFRPTILINILPMFLLAVSVTDAIHFQSVYRDLRGQDQTNEEAIIQATTVTGIPMLFTSLTTMMGLFSFRFASSEAIHELGLIGGVGVGVAFILTMAVLPVVLSWNTKHLIGKRSGNQRDWMDHILTWFNLFSGRNDKGTVKSDSGKGLRVIILGIALLISSIYFMQAINLWHDPLTWFDPQEPIRVSYEVVDEHLGGTSFLSLFIKPRGERGMRDLEFLKRLEQVEQTLRDYRDPESDQIVLGHSVSLLGLIRETNRSLHQSDERFYRLPDTQAELNDIFFVLESLPPRELSRLMSFDAQLSHMTFATRWLPAHRYGPLTDVVEATLEEHVGTRADVEPTGIVYMFYSTVSAMIMDLLKSFGFAFLVITVLMMLILRNLKLGLIAMVPNLTPIIFLFGFMGLTGIPLDLTTLLLTSLALGLCVDDTIHLLHHFKYQLHRSGDTDEAIAYALNHSGRAVITTSLLLVAGSCLYLGSELVTLQRFGVLIGMTIVFAGLADLIITPAVLRATHRS